MTVDAWLSTLLLAAACALWIVHAERRREQRRLAALAIAERVMRRRGEVRAPAQCAPSALSA